MKAKSLPSRCLQIHGSLIFFRPIIIVYFTFCGAPFLTCHLNNFSTYPLFLYCSFALSLKSHTPSLYLIFFFFFIDPSKLKSQNQSFGNISFAHLWINPYSSRQMHISNTFSLDLPKKETVWHFYWIMQ